jgi:hypothetical protein
MSAEQPQSSVYEVRDKFIYKIFRVILYDECTAWSFRTLQQHAQCYFFKKILHLFLQENMLNVGRALCRDKLVIIFLRIDKFVTENVL